MGTRKVTQWDRGTGLGVVQEGRAWCGTGGTGLVYHFLPRQKVVHQPRPSCTTPSPSLGPTESPSPSP